MSNEYPITVERLAPEQGGGFLGAALDLPGCISDGDTEQEAIDNTRQAVREWIDEANRLGRRIPEASVHLHRAEA